MASLSKLDMRVGRTSVLSTDWAFELTRSRCLVMYALVKAEQSQTSSSSDSCLDASSFHCTMTFRLQKWSFECCVFLRLAFEAEEGMEGWAKISLMKFLFFIFQLLSSVRAA